MFRCFSLTFWSITHCPGSILLCCPLSSTITQHFHTTAQPKPLPQMQIYQEFKPCSSKRAGHQRWKPPSSPWKVVCTCTQRKQLLQLKVCTTASPRRHGEQTPHGTNKNKALLSGFLVPELSLALCIFMLCPGLLSLFSLFFPSNPQRFIIFGLSQSPPAPAPWYDVEV